VAPSVIYGLRYRREASPAMRLGRELAERGSLYALTVPITAMFSRRTMSNGDNQRDLAHQYGVRDRLSVIGNPRADRPTCGVRPTEAVWPSLNLPLNGRVSACRGLSRAVAETVDDLRFRDIGQHAATFLGKLTPHPSVKP
jgi:hypothetical protein